jgi:hypothetical protein
MNGYSSRKVEPKAGKERPDATLTNLLHLSLPEKADPLWKCRLRATVRGLLFNELAPTDLGRIFGMRWPASQSILSC